MGADQLDGSVQWRGGGNGGGGRMGGGAGGAGRARADWRVAGRRNVRWGKAAGARGARGALVVALACVVATAIAGCGKDTGGASPTTGPAATTANGGAPAPEASRLVAADGAAGDNLGGAVWYNTFEQPIKPVYYATAGEAAMSSDGKLAVVGAPGAANGTKPGAGAAYVFVERAGRWSQAAKLVPTVPAAYDAFGWTVAVSGD